MVAETLIEVTATQLAGHPREELKDREETILHLAHLHAEGTIHLDQDLLVASLRGKTVAEIKVRASMCSNDNLINKQTFNNKPEGYHTAIPEPQILK